MKKNYLLPRQNVVEIDEKEMLCTSPGTKPMNVKLNDYSTYEDTKRSNENPVNWDGIGTGSDF